MVGYSVKRLNDEGVSAETKRALIMSSEEEEKKPGFVER